jgi:hypothetical protein
MSHKHEADDSSVSGAGNEGGIATAQPQLGGGGPGREQSSRAAELSPHPWLEHIGRGGRRPADPGTRCAIQGVHRALTC